MLFYIKAKVYIKVFGISAEHLREISVIVKAANREMAKEKFRQHCQRTFAHMQYDSIRYEFDEIAEEIQ